MSDDLDRELERLAALPQIDGEDMIRITKDVALGTPPDSTYDADMREVYKYVDNEFERWREIHPDAILDIPAELPRADIVVSAEPPPPLPEETKT